MNPLDLKGKYKSSNHVVPNFNKTYHPRFYSDDYKNHTFGFNKAASQTEYERDREKKVNSWSIKDLLGCTNR